jgi:hypothetical protein
MIITTNLAITTPAGVCMRRMHRHVAWRGTAMDIINLGINRLLVMISRSQTVPLLRALARPVEYDVTTVHSMMSMIAHTAASRDMK